MKLSAFALMLLTAAPSVSSAAQTDPARVAQVRQSIQSQMSAEMTAERNRNAQSVLATKSPDFAATMADGAPMNRAEMETATKARLTALVTLADDAGATIDSLTVQNHEATVYATRHDDRTATVDGQSVHLTGDTRQRESWTETNSGWLLRRVDVLSDGSTDADGQALGRVIWTDGVAAAKAKVAAERQADPGAVPFAAATLNHVGQDLLERGRTKDAIAVYQMVVKAYPADADAFAGLADGFAKDGDKGLAMQFYSRALSINPQHAAASQKLAHLQGQGR